MTHDKARRAAFDFCKGSLTCLRDKDTREATMMLQIMVDGGLPFADILSRLVGRDDMAKLLRNLATYAITVSKVREMASAAFVTPWPWIDDFPVFKRECQAICLCTSSEYHTMQGDCMRAWDDLHKVGSRQLLRDGDVRISFFRSARLKVMIEDALFALEQALVNHDLMRPVDASDTHRVKTHAMVNMAKRRRGQGQKLVIEPTAVPEPGWILARYFQVYEIEKYLAELNMAGARAMAIGAWYRRTKLARNARDRRNRRSEGTIGRIDEL